MPPHLHWLLIIKVLASLKKWHTVTFSNPYFCEYMKKNRHQFRRVISFPLSIEILWVISRREIYTA